MGAVAEGSADAEAGRGRGQLAARLGRVDLLVSGIILIALVGWLCDVLLMRALSAVSVSLRRQ